MLYPEGSPLTCATMPEIAATHLARLRFLWQLGRPAQVPRLEGIDLDLLVHGLIAVQDETHRASHPVVVPTREGVARLNDARQALIAHQQPHHHLAARLASHLQAKGLWTWENLEFMNPAPLDARSWGMVRPDVFACKPTLRAESAAPVIYEVKISRADFLADLAKPAKRGAYADLAEAVYYCAPLGLLDKGEIPAGCGLLCEVGPGQFKLAKSARRQKGFVLAPDTVMTLMVKRERSPSC